MVHYFDHISKSNELPMVILTKYMHHGDTMYFVHLKKQHHKFVSLLQCTCIILIYVNTYTRFHCDALDNYKLCFFCDRLHTKTTLRYPNINKT